MNKKILLLILNLCFLWNISAQKTTLIMGGIAHLGTGGKIALLLILGGAGAVSSARVLV